MEIDKYFLVRFFLLLIMLSTQIWAYKSLNIDTSNISFAWVQWNKSENLLNPHHILGQTLEPLPKSVQAYGLDTRYYNYLIQLEILNPHEAIYIQFPLGQGQICHLSMFFKDKTLFKKESNIDAKKIFLTDKTFQGYVVLQCTSLTPRFNALTLGSASYLKIQNQTKVNIFFLVTGILVSLIAFYLFILFAIKDYIYLYYIMYIIGFYSLNFIFINNSNISFLEEYGDSHLFLTINVLFLNLMMVLFTSKYLLLQTYHPILNKILLIGGYSVVIIHIIEYYLGVVLLSPLSIVFLNIAILYSAVMSYLKGYKPALFFLLATGGLLLFVLAEMLTHFGIFFSYTYLSENFLIIGMVLDTILLSLALAYRVQKIQEEKYNINKQLLLQSKFSAMGEITGNISHQWREPLGGLGAILTKLKASLMYKNPSKEEVLKSIDKSHTIIQHLSETIDTFKSFYIIEKEEESFSLNSTIESSLNFIDELYTQEHIKILFIPQEECQIQGKSNEFSQAFLSIIHNAKEAMLERNIVIPHIHITTQITDKKVFIKISDNGGGIDVRPIESIFHANISDKKLGSGMGLYITKLVIEDKLHGEVKVENTDEGACFILILQSASLNNSF